MGLISFHMCKHLPRMYWSGSPATLRATISSRVLAEGAILLGGSAKVCFIHLSSVAADSGPITRDSLESREGTMRGEPAMDAV